MPNNKIIQDWKLKSKKYYPRLYAGKNIELKPKIDRKYACALWHIKGYWFYSCKNKATCITSKDTEVEFKEQFSIYIDWHVWRTITMLVPSPAHCIHTNECGHYTCRWLHVVLHILIIIHKLCVSHAYAYMYKHKLGVHVCV